MIITFIKPPAAISLSLSLSLSLLQVYCHCSELDASLPPDRPVQIARVELGLIAVGIKHKECTPDVPIVHRTTAQIALREKRRRIMCAISSCLS